MNDTKKFQIGLTKHDEDEEDSNESKDLLSSPTPNDKLTLQELMKSQELRTIFQAFCMKEL